MTTTDSYGTIRRWHVEREHHHHFTAGWTELQRAQYRGSVGSTSSRQRRIPPVRFATRPKPASARCEAAVLSALDRKSTRLNSSHVEISYAVFCLKKKK